MHTLKRLQHKLFPTWYHSIISVIILLGIAALLPTILNWLIFKADFIGTGPEACTSGGACWVFIRMRFDQFMYGFYPRDLVWRINLSYALGVLLILCIIYAPRNFKKWFVLSLFIIFPIVSVILYHGGIFGLEQVDTYSWSGLHLTILLAVGSILLSLPIGILLALGRMSKMPVIHSCSVVFIELWRGVPLVSVLFMASVLIPMFITEGVHIDRVLRALIGITLFYSAYMAEIIHRGLVALPKGQFEAADALDFPYWQSTRLIILPQVLKKVIPGIAQVFISLFKETTLVLIIGLFDFLGMVQAASEDPRWADFGLEGYVFAAFVYWIFCHTMSYYSKHLAHKLQKGNK